jgi:recombination protein RecT
MTNQTTPKTEVQTKKPDEVKHQSPAERFTAAIEREFSHNAGEVTLTRFQKKLCQSYFIKIDLSLKAAEKKRLGQAEKYRDKLSYTWDNVNLPKLAIDVITYSSVGLDPLQPNHVNPIPFKNELANKYDFTFIIGYRGMELKAKKYGLDVPDEVTIELTYSTDIFKPIKKDIEHEYDTYKFDIVNPFDRGEVTGGFFYYSYFDKPYKNKLKTFSIKDIEKRKPAYAAVEFWGGERDKWVWDDAKQKMVKAGKEEVEGWYDEMCYKTIARAAYNGITIDSEKIDENFLNIAAREQESRDLMIFNEVDENANRKQIGFTPPPDGATNEKSAASQPGASNKVQEQPEPKQPIDDEDPETSPEITATF